MSSLEDIEARRAARKAALADQEKAQRAIDLEAIDALEQAHGDSNVKAMTVPFTPGLPTMAAVRAPDKVIVKRYRDSVKKRSENDQPDIARANEAVCSVTLIYPEPEIFEKMCEARPGLKSQLGFAAMGLSVASDASEGKG